MVALSLALAYLGSLALTAFWLRLREGKAQNLAIAAATKAAQDAAAACREETDALAARVRNVELAQGIRRGGAPG